MRQPRFEVYTDKRGVHHWRLLSANGRTVADSGEAYTRRRDALRAVTSTIEAVERIGHRRMIERIKARGN